MTDSTTGRWLRLAAPVLVVALATPGHASVTGRVVDADGKPLEGAQVCMMVTEQSRGLCSETDAEGHYVLPSSAAQFLAVEKRGYLPERVESVDQARPIVLSRAAVLRVRMFDNATGEPIPAGRFFLQYSTGRSVGPLPTRGGDLVVRLHPGQAIGRGEAEGYAPAAGGALTLVAGEEQVIELRLLQLAPVRRDSDEAQR